MNYTDVTNTSSSPFDAWYSSDLAPVNVYTPPAQQTVTTVPTKREPIVISVSSRSAFVSSVTSLLPVAQPAATLQADKVTVVDSKLISNTKILLALGAVLYLGSKLLALVSLMIKIFIIMPIIITFVLLAVGVIAFSKMSYEDLFSLARSQISKLFCSRQPAPQVPADWS